VIRKLPLVGVSLVVILAGLGLANPFSYHVTAQQPATGLAPRFRVDPFWPQPLPNKWILSEVAGVAVDAQDHVWIIQRPKALSEDEKSATPAGRRVRRVGDAAGAHPRPPATGPDPPRAPNVRE